MSACRYCESEHCDTDCYACHRAWFGDGVGPTRKTAAQIREPQNAVIATLRAALVEACDGWQGCWESDNNDSAPPRIAELRKKAEQ